MPEIRRSVCALDCPDCCSLLVNVEDGRGSKLRGDPAHPVTRGFLCGKVAQYLEREYSPDRLLYPQRRVGAKGQGRFERISWDEALDTIAGRLRGIAEEFGPEAILPYSYAGTMGLLNGAGMDRRFFHRLGASRLDRTICSSAGMAGMTEALGLRYGTEPEQFRHSRLIIAWGANILGTNVHLWPFVVEARRNGAKLYTIDPRRNRTGAAGTSTFDLAGLSVLWHGERALGGGEAAPGGRNLQLAGSKDDGWCILNGTVESKMEIPVETGLI
jgi:anaerobic selenocysteine-containing dehydrogenase